MQTIYIDISNKNVIPTIYAKQGEVGRKFLAVLTDDSVPYSLPAGYAFSVWYDGDSGEGNYTHIGEKSAFSVDGNKVAVEMIAQMLSVPGEGKMCLVLNYGENQTATWNIEYVVESVPGAESEKAEEYYTAFSQTVSELPYPDDSLSVAGKAADAAATGAALASKAPAGFGLGEQNSKQLLKEDDLNAASRNGFYSWASAPTNAPFDNGIMLVATYDWARKVQVVWSTENNKLVKQRCQYGNTWGAWVDVGASAFAPAGFGLGTGGAAFQFSEIDNIKKNGWYATSCPNTTMFGITFHYAAIRCDVWDANNCRQTLYPVSNLGIIFTRVCFNGTWQAWECLNPPMILGVEYRTTERWKGKAVYTKAIDCGAFSNAADNVSVPHNLSVTTVLGCDGELYSGTRHLSAPYFSMHGDLMVSANENDIVLRTTQSGFGAYGAIVRLKYTKD